jgi:hypothetical protein
VPVPAAQPAHHAHGAINMMTRPRRACLRGSWSRSTKTAHAIELVQPFRQSNRIAAPETVGHPTRTAQYITQLPKAEHDAKEWQAAMEALIFVPVASTSTARCSLANAALNLLAADPDKVERIPPFVRHL